MRRLSYANVTSTLALVAALSGGAYAAGLIGPNDIADNAVRSRHIQNGQVKPADLAPVPAWQEVADPPPGVDACATDVGVFCSDYYYDVPTWTNYGSGYATAAFYRDERGVVHLRGVVVPPGGFYPETSAKQLTMFRLPQADQPPAREIFSVVGRSTDGQEVAAGRVDVTQSGAVVFEWDCEQAGVSGPNSTDDCSANGGYISLDGITFRTD